MILYILQIISDFVSSSVYAVKSAASGLLGHNLALRDVKSLFFLSHSILTAPEVDQQHGQQPMVWG